MPQVMIDPEIREAFRAFARNGRWGTCGFCPRDGEGVPYPEFCEATDRYDHQLNVDQLAAVHKRYLESYRGKTNHGG